MCTELNCKYESEQCSLYPVEACSDSNIKYFCPKLCGLCEETSCGQVLNCGNNGEFNPYNCSCFCLPMWSGNSCDILNCSKEEPEFCKNNLDLSYCKNSNVVSFCPKLCGLCEESTIDNNNTKTTTVAKGCDNTLICENSGFFNPATCKCDCLATWSGESIIIFL